jgi:hypothetical protein
MPEARTAILEILQGLDALDTDATAKRQFRQLVRAVATGHGFAWAKKEGQIDFARELLVCRVSRATIRDRLIAHFDVSRTEAYRIIDRSLKLSQKWPKNGTHPGPNNFTNEITGLPHESQHYPVKFGSSEDGERKSHDDQ